jgi:hypothetical protein
MGIAAIASLPVQVAVDPDGLRAWLVTPDGANLSRFNAQNLNMVLEAAEIAVNDDVVARIREFLKHTNSLKASAKRFLIAKGTPPVDATDAGFQWDQPPDAPSPSENAAQFQHRLWCSMRLVEKGAVVGKIIPAVSSAPGVDVHANAIDPIRPKGAPVRLMENLILADDGVTVKAAAPGRAVYEHPRLTINPLVEAAVTDPAKTGPLEVDTDLLIRATVDKSWKIASKRSVIIVGSVQAAQVTAEEDIVVHFGIVGRSGSKVAAGRDLLVDSCEDAVLQAGRDLYLGSSAENSRIYVRGMLWARAASLVGGRTRVGRGMEVQTLGSDARTPTHVAVAPPWNTVQKASRLEEEIAEKRQQAATIQAEINPLADALKHLTPVQKEQMTELQYQADTLKADIAKAQEERNKLEIELGGGGFVRASRRVHPGVAITIGSLVAEIQRELRGPVKIEQQKIGDAMRIVAVGESDKSLTMLETKRAGQSS